MPRTLLDKLWDAHVVDSLAPGVDLMNVDRHYLLEMRAGALNVLESRGLPVRDPHRTIGVVDHVISTAPGRLGGASWTARHLATMRAGCARHGIVLLDEDHPDQGIAHVVGPELGLTHPGMLVVCPDSHTSTHGALGALAWGIGFSEVAHVLGTSTIVQRRPARMRIHFEGTPPPGIVAKDLALAAIAVVGAGGGVGHAIEFTGPAISALGVEGRMTLCNMAVELGAKIGLVAPDDRVIAWMCGRRHAPSGPHWEPAVAAWRGLFSDPGATFERDVVVPVGELAPQITWGTSPEHVLSVTGHVPDPASAPDPGRAKAWAAALDYMGLRPGQALVGLAVDQVFIGSCTNARLSDLREAAAAIDGGKVAPGVTAWVVAGSQAVKRAAETEGLDQRFRAAGFDWREPGCSLCVGANGETVPSGARCVSTSNRNFVGRQGPGARTHLASPALAARAAIAGCITDPRG
ncbi:MULTISPECIES: 3-isopropylmalate dehydratase large subunit [Roseomonadaceae]|uniref:3-isopropylmalate dehydratase large subunit n=1 Tax=Falsiroseomonas oleicola TaxID=2801474 RepID=A0ABS6H7W8_9PROT|nr:3-isopropylmalate dehydratase large subunit [Roseomonas oleicola]MBU8544789.1 3-isopropylmalate dehydratase large subunit [Roseomonas oleicola]